MREVAGFLILMISLAAAPVGAGTPTPDNSPRLVQLFDEGWKFHLGDAVGASEAAFDDRNWRSVDLPHDWSIELPFDPKLASGTGYLPGGLGWYRKSFRLPSPATGKRVSVLFDGVYMNSEVWINVSASDANGDPLTFYIDLGDWVGTVEASTLGGTTDQQYVNVSYTYADEGRMPIIVYVNDSFLDGSHNVSGPFDVSVLADNSPTAFTLQSHYTAFYNMTIRVAPVTISDPDSDALAVWYDWGDGTDLSRGNATYVGDHVYRILGTNTVTVAVDDVCDCSCALYPGQRTVSHFASGSADFPVPTRRTVK